MFPSEFVAGCLAAEAGTLLFVLRLAVNDSSKGRAAERTCALSRWGMHAQNGTFFSSFYDGAGVPLVACRPGLHLGG